MKILLTVASFFPKYGGPAISVSRLGEALARGGAEVSLWAPDGSAATSSIMPRGNIVACLGCALDEALVSASPDLVHDNGIWMPYNHLLSRRCRRLGVIRIVSPRGTLEPWAMQYKRAKKSIAWHVYQKRDLLLADGLHATAQVEAERFKALGLTPPVHVIPNGMDLPNDTDIVQAVEARLASEHYKTALFLSRVHPKKGLPLLVEAWGRLRPAGWRLVIAGPSELGHAQEIARLARRLEIDHCVQIVGPKYGKDKVRLLKSSHLFILPTYSENFGMAVAEALAYGLPVLTTTGAPWAELEVHRCGWWVAPDVASIAAALERAFATSANELNAMGLRGRQLIEREYSWARIAAAMLNAYEESCRLARTR